MSFGKRLDLLMAVLNLSNRQLARALNLDPSLVSRWRTGARTQAKGGPHLKALASHLASRAKTAYHHAALAEILGLPPGSDPPEASALADLLLDWLSQEAAPGAELVNHLMNRPEGFAAGLRAAPPFARVEPETTPGAPGRSEVFYGAEGKRRATLRFMQAVAVAPPGTLMLYSDESIEWFAHHRAFLAQFVPLFLEVIRRGHRVKMVHVIQRDLSEMLAGIDFWMPFYLTGGVDPYYCPRYREHYFRRTLFVAPGVAALTCATLAGRLEEAPNFLFTDPAMVAALTEEFNEFLRLCRPLMRIFTGPAPEGLGELVREFEEEPGDCYCLLNSLSLATLPEETFGEVLARSGLEERVTETFRSLHRSRAAALANNLSRHHRTEILSLLEPEDLAAGRVPLESPDLAGGTGLYYSPAEFARHLRHLAHLLERQERQHLVLARRLPFPHVRVYAKEETGVIVAHTAEPLAVFAFNEPHLTNAFCCYLEGMVDRAPLKDRDRQAVREELLSLAELLG
ncbi:MAG: hypothetical protein ACPLPT_00750 [Moorellales bacterium]